MRRSAILLCTLALAPSLILAAPAAAPQSYNPFGLPGFENPAASLMNGLANLITNNPRSQIISAASDAANNAVQGVVTAQPIRTAAAVAAPIGSVANGILQNNAQAPLTGALSSAASAASAAFSPITSVLPNAQSALSPLASAIQAALRPNFLPTNGANGLAGILPNLPTFPVVTATPSTTVGTSTAAAPAPTVAAPAPAPKMASRKARKESVEDLEMAAPAPSMPEVLDASPAAAPMAKEEADDLEADAESAAGDEEMDDASEPTTQHS
eukprot:jgi/Botrbrau1/10897/Bobra.0025s0071.2